MKTLLIKLPLTAHQPDWAYSHAWLSSNEPQGAIDVQEAPLGLLPEQNNAFEFVFLAPPKALSWHIVKLPAGLKKQPGKLLAALQGLLEDKLLQDPTHLHIALPKQWAPQEDIWVCVCDRMWLESHIRSFEASGRTVSKIVPEFAPPESGQQIHAVGDPRCDVLWITDAHQGVVPLPLQMLGEDTRWIDLTKPLQCEPAWADAVQARDLPLTLETTSSNWRVAIDNNWDLAQFSLQSNASSRSLRQLRRWTDSFWHAPQWKPARLGLLAMLLTQWVGINAWAWRTQQNWAEQTKTWQTILQTSFPKVSVVIDAPLQMQREVDRLQKNSGKLARSDFEALLSQMSDAWPVHQKTPHQLQYQNGQLIWPLADLKSADAKSMSEKLARHSYTLQQESETWRLKPKELQR